MTSAANTGNAIERLRALVDDPERHLEAKPSWYHDAHNAIDAVEALCQAAKELGDSHGNPYDEAYAESTQQTFALGGSYVSRKRLDALAAAVRRVEAAQ